jgi:hypothetical protein
MRVQDLRSQARARSTSRMKILTVGLTATLLVGLSIQLAFPPDNAMRTALYTALGILVTVVVADAADLVQRQIHDFLMERVNSRSERTEVVTELCKEASHEFHALTFFPVVGIWDDPEHAPWRYLLALEEALGRGVEVELVSVSCEEAQEYCDKADPPHGSASQDTLAWAEERLSELARRFPDSFKRAVIPGEAITINICHHESAALMYHMGLKEDTGSGFRSTDARIVDVAKGGLQRYLTFHSPPA